MADSTNANDATQTTEPAQTTTPDSGAVPSSTDTGDTSAAPAAGAQSTGFKFTAGAGVPDWAVGKTAQEVAAIAGQLHDAVRTGQPTAAAAPMAAAPAQPALQAPAVARATQDEWIQDPVTAAAKDRAYDTATQFAPAVSQFATQLSGQARTLAQLQDPDAFKRWGPEIDMMVQQIEPQFRTVENIQKLVGIVKSNHIDELVTEGVSAKVEQMQQSGGLRSDTGIAAGVAPNAVGRLDLDSAELPDNYRRVLSRYNITPETLDEYLTKTECATRGLTLQQARDEWLKQAKDGDVITEAPLRIG